jgi:hypothetical protein
VRARDLSGALVEAAELRPLNLGYALALVVLFGEAGDPRFPRASARWLARLVLERADVQLADVRGALDALAALPHDPPCARRALAAVCAAHDVPGGARLL